MIPIYHVYIIPTYLVIYVKKNTETTKKTLSKCVLLFAYVRR